MAGAGPGGAAQHAATGTQPPELIDNTQEVYYENAQPYSDDPVHKLEKAVHGLRGLKPVQSQQLLPLILSRTGNRLEALLAKLPDVTAQERVVQIQSFNHGNTQFRLRHEYNYLILVRQANGETILSEHRTALKGGSFQSGLLEGFAVTAGFATLWKFFLPSLREESRFRYLGVQRVNKKLTYVVSFAERPGWVALPGQAVIDGKSIRCLYQGIAWINASDFQIVRLRTDLLAPRPDVNLTKMTSVVYFGPVHIAQVASPLWLPLKAEVTTEMAGALFKNVHRYSKYKLFRSQVKFLTSIPPGGKQ
jgi:hypothetical protein